ncbi:hypothetical protein [Methylobacterium mesophilicum]|uniref:hypothetical protein n=1 Tax=Methylobacterium mesophilicum TaxID=39956 RepID=UPI002F2F011B
MRRTTRDLDPDFVVDAIASLRNTGAQIGCTCILLMAIMVIGTIFEPTEVTPWHGSAADPRPAKTHSSKQGHEEASTHVTAKRC